MRSRECTTHAALSALALATALCVATPLGLAQYAPPEETLVRTTNAYPTGDAATSVLLLERFAPGAVRRGEPFTYEIKVTNLTSGPLGDVTVTEQLPQGLNIARIEPPPTRSAAGSAAWVWESWGARESQVIRITGTATSATEVTGCATVTIQAAVCATTQIVQPKLVIEKTAPAEVLLCDPIPVRIVVRNTGSGVAHNVRIRDALPEGWTTENGQHSFTASAGNLRGGEARELTLSVRADRTGQFTNVAEAFEDGGLSARASTTTVVRQPELVVTKTGPAMRYIGRPAEFQIRVANQGNAAAQQTVLTDQLPAGVEIIEASDGGDVSGNQITWNLGTIAPQQAHTVTFALRPTQRGMLRNTAVARAYCAEAEGICEMEVRGIPAILLEVIDTSDPLEVGHNETYLITVTNQGSAEDINIVITCVLPPEQEFVSATGPTLATADGQTVRFAPLPMLAPKAVVTYHVIARGIKAGDVRFKTTMETGDRERPVEETESTTIY